MLVGVVTWTREIIRIYIEFEKKQKKNKKKKQTNKKKNTKQTRKQYSIMATRLCFTNLMQMSAYQIQIYL